MLKIILPLIGLIVAEGSTESALLKVAWFVVFIAVIQILTGGIEYNKEEYL